MRKLKRGTLELWTEKVSSLMRLSQERQFRSSSLSLHREKSNLIFIHSAPVSSLSSSVTTTQLFWYFSPQSWLFFFFSILFISPNLSESN